MKYYCEDCGMEFADDDCFVYPIDIDDTCPVCEGFGLIEIPVHETVAQWEKRRVRKYPDTAPVYVLGCREDDYESSYENPHECGYFEMCRVEHYVCECHHRKWPTPEQFREEYGREWGDLDSVYILVTDADEDGEKTPVLDRTDWVSYPYHGAKERGFKTLVCACTPWGKPPADWRPE